MEKFTYVVTDVVGKEGHHYPLLTSNEYPWMNIQIIPTPDEDIERILAELKKQGGWIAKAEGRDDFVAIHAVAVQRSIRQSRLPSRMSMRFAMLCRIAFGLLLNGGLKTEIRSKLWNTNIKLLLILRTLRLL